MKIKEITGVLEEWAPKALQESYDNSGLQVGDPEAFVRKALVCLDCTEAVVEEAERLDCDLVISHHPLIFKGLRSLVATGPVERTVLSLIRKNIALYAIHTNLDNVISGVNGEIADRLGLRVIQVLDPKPEQLYKLAVFVPIAQAEAVRNAMFAAGAGHIGKYDECSFGSAGTGTFRAGAGAEPYSGSIGVRHEAEELKLEMVLPRLLLSKVMAAMRATHPYEEVACDILPLVNTDDRIGSGLIGEWDRPMSGPDFLSRLKQVFGIQVVRHTALLDRSISRVAVCGGSGAFLIGKAKAANVDAFITGDIKYHDFFDADGQLVLADIGHYGSEQFTAAVIKRYLEREFPTFAVHLTETVTDPTQYS